MTINTNQVICKLCSHKNPITDKIMNRLGIQVPCCSECFVWHHMRGGTLANRMDAVVASYTAR